MTTSLIPLVDLAQALACLAVRHGLTPVEYRIGPDFEEVWGEIKGPMQITDCHAVGERELLGLPVRPMTCEGFALRSVR